MANKLNMNRVSLGRHCGFAHDLGETRVGMDGHPYLLWRPLDQLSEDALGYEVRYVRPYGVHAQEKIGLRIGDHFHEAVGLALDQGLADGPKGELRLLDLVALLLGLLPGEPKRSDLRATEGNARNYVLVERHRVLAGHVLDRD